MSKVAEFVCKHKKLILIITLLLLIPSIIGMKATRINYDILVYLPEDIETIQGEDILSDEFNMGGFSIIVLKETAVGMILGFMCNLCFYIINFAGQLIDMELGLSMANMFDPATNVQVTVTGNIYNYFVMLMLVATNMHYYIIRAIFDSFSYFNVGKAVFHTSLKEIMVDFVANYFLIAVRIVLPIFCCMLIINVVLGVLAKAAPQMNMFVVGIQIKVLVGLILLLILVQTIPSVSDFIFSEMRDVITQVIHGFQP